MLFASSNRVHIRNQMQSLEETGLCLQNPTTNLPFTAADFSYTSGREQNKRCWNLATDALGTCFFLKYDDNYQLLADQCAWGLELYIPMVKNGVWFLDLHQTYSSSMKIVRARGRVIILYCFLGQFRTGGCFKKPLNATSSRWRQQELQIFSKALNSSLAVSGESISMWFRASRKAGNKEMSLKNKSRTKCLPIN